MPLYPYRCTDCEREFEEFVGHSRSRATTPTVCPTCGSSKVERELALPAKTTTRELPATNCAGDGPPCGASWCGRKST